MGPPPSLSASLSLSRSSTGTTFSELSDSSSSTVPSTPAIPQAYDPAAKLPVNDHYFDGFKYPHFVFYLHYVLAGQSSNPLQGKRQSSQTSPREVPNSHLPFALRGKTTKLDQRWIDDGSKPPYTWSSIMGMILLDKKRAGDHTGMSIYQLQEEVPKHWTCFTLDDSARRGGWAASMMKSLQADATNFIKHGKETTDRDMRGNKGEDKWVIGDAKEDQFVSTEKNLTMRNGAGGKNKTRESEEAQGEETFKKQKK